MNGKNLTLTNAETRAVSAACELVKSIHQHKVLIYIDSTYIVDCVLALMNRWATNEWRNIGNSVYLQELDAAWKGIDLAFVIIAHFYFLTTYLDYFSSD